MADQPGKGDTFDTIADTIIKVYKVGKIPLVLISIGGFLVLTLLTMGIIEGLGAASIRIYQNYFLYFYIAGVLFLILGVVIYFIYQIWRRRMVFKITDSYYKTIGSIISTFTNQKMIDTSVLNNLFISLAGVSELYFGKDIEKFIDKFMARMSQQIR
jgi:hypothetical protein